MTAPADRAAEGESLRALRVLAAMEGVSFAVLLVASVLKRTTGPNVVPIVGALHGTLYIVVVLLVLENLRRLRWSPRFTALMLTVGSPGLHFALQAQARERDLPA